ncbi:MAG: 30S ribosomal protein S4 [Anaplasmataceae bacterium]|nr:30S ribosomal protein S4 [Anaplasmataceae bacterium]
MSTIVTSKDKASRRAGVSLWGNPKDAVHKKKYRPGQHGGQGMHRSKQSEFAKQFKAQKNARAYYCIRLKQLKNIYKKTSSLSGNKVNNFIGMLESLLPVFLVRAKIASTIYFARQLVSHGHVLVNNKRVDINYYFLKPNDEVTIKDKMKSSSVVTESMKELRIDIPEYISVDQETFKSVFLHRPSHDEVPYAMDMNINLVMESM